MIESRHLKISPTQGDLLTTLYTGTTEERKVEHFLTKEACKVTSGMFAFINIRVTGLYCAGDKYKNILKNFR